jgi:hypothetical protein
MPKVKKIIDEFQLTKEEKEALKKLLKEAQQKPSEISKIQSELWKEDYDEKPVSFKEFLEGDRFLKNIGIYPKWREVLEDFFSKNKQELIICSAIGTGKTTIGCVALLYQVYKLLCLKDPQKYYGLLSGFPIVFGLYNIFKYKAGQVVLDKFRALLNLIPWFQDKINRNLASENMIVFNKNIKIVIGSRELDAIGEDLYGCLIDEVNFMKQSSVIEKQQALNLYEAIRTRIISRFRTKGRTPGLLILVSSKRTESDFLQVHINKVRDSAMTYVCEFALWAVKPWVISGKTFKVVVGDRIKGSRILAENEPIEPGAKVIDVPIEFKREFELNIDQALRDIANIATYAYKPLIPDISRLYKCIDSGRQSPTISEYAIAGLDDDYKLSDYLILERVVKQVGTNWEVLVHPEVPRYMHLDLSQVKDYTGLAIVHHDGFIEEERTDFNGVRYSVYVPKFYVDLVLQIRYGNSRIDYSKIRDFIFYLNRIGFKFAKITADSYQSADFIQILQKSGFKAETISVDKTVKPYMILRELIMGQRINMYQHSLLIEELSKLEYYDDLDKVDHPPEGSKDLADALAGSIASCYADVSTFATYKPITVVQPTNLRPNIKSVIGDDLWITKEKGNYIIDDNLTKLNDRGYLLGG